MPRTYGNIVTAIWRDPQFRQLSVDAQHTYLMLVTQTDISSVGTLPMTLRRWSNHANDLTPERLSIAIAELTDRQFTIIDWEIEELLVRSFVKWDGGYKNPKRVLAIKAAAAAVSAPALRNVLAGELDRLGVTHTIKVTPIDELSNGDGTPIDPPRSVVTLVGSTHTPQSAFSNPQSAVLKPQSTDHEKSFPSPAPPSTPSEPDPWLFTEFWKLYPRKVGKEAARRSWARAIRKANPDDIVAGAGRYASDENLPDQQFIPHPEKWLNDGRWSDPALAVRSDRQPKRATTDVRVGQNMDLAHRIEQSEAQHTHDRLDQREEIRSGKAVGVGVGVRQPDGR